MAQQTINIGAAPDDGTGDSLRVGGDKINDNFTELYALAPYVPGGTDVAVTDGGTGASTASGARTNLGLVIGTDIQAQDAELAAIAGLTSAADKAPYFTGSGTAALATVTSFARTILDDVDAAAVRATIGAGTGSGSGDMVAANNLSDVANAATAAHNLGLGTADSPQLTGINLGHASDTTITRTGAGDIAIEGNAVYRAGGTDVPVTDGGTGSSTAGGARTNLGLVIGADVQAYSAVLANVASSTHDAALKPLEHIQIACSDETTAITTGTAKVTFRMPYAFTVTDVRASVNTAPTGSTILIDINEAGTTILSTKLMIDASEKTSTTAATPAVISDSSLADDAEITIDFDQVGSTIAGKGVKVIIIGHRT